MPAKAGKGSGEPLARRQLYCPYSFTRHHIARSGGPKARHYKCRYKAAFGSKQKGYNKVFVKKFAKIRIIYNFATEGQYWLHNP